MNICAFNESDLGETQNFADIIFIVCLQVSDLIMYFHVGSFPIRSIVIEFDYLKRTIMKLLVSESLSVTLIWVEYHVLVFLFLLDVKFCLLVIISFNKDNYHDLKDELL